MLDRNAKNWLNRFLHRNLETTEKTQSQNNFNILSDISNDSIFKAAMSCIFKKFVFTTKNSYKTKYLTFYRSYAIHKTYWILMAPLFFINGI